MPHFDAESSAPIKRLGKADMPFDGCVAYMIQGKKEQVLYTQFEKDVEVPEHSHEAQLAVVLSGNIEITIKGTRSLFFKGDTYYIPRGLAHSAKIRGGYSDFTFIKQNRSPR